MTPEPGSRRPASPGGAGQDQPRSPGGDAESGSERQLVQPAGEWHRPPSDPDHSPRHRWLESRPAKDHGAPCDHRGGGGKSRPVDAVGQSSRQPSATLLAASRDNGSASTSSHPLSETVLSGSTSSVGLIRTLHEWSPGGIGERRQEGERPNAVENDGIGSAADQTGPMSRDGSRTGRVSAPQATSRSGDAPTVTMTMPPIKREPPRSCPQDPQRPKRANRSPSAAPNLNPHAKPSRSRNPETGTEQARRGA